MEYKDLNIYEHNGDNSARFLLGKDSDNPLFVIGVNPSTADDKIPDPTLRKVMGFAERNDFTSFIMLNLYPQRATNPNDMHKQEDDSLIDENVKNISKKIDEYDENLTITIVAAWGNLITKRKYLRKCLEKIYNSLKENKKIEWKMVGNLTKKGHPRHLLPIPYKEPFSTFDIKNYINKNNIK